MSLTMTSICEGALCAFFILLEITIIYYIWSGKINLSLLISEKDPPYQASMSRFQLLVFTFVIAMSLFFVIMGKPGSAPGFPKEIPGGTLALLGISGSSYLVSKGISTKDTGNGGPKPGPAPAPGEKEG